MHEAGARPYVGRFAPSPTGPLHFGSLLAACASYLEARANDGRWLLRIEDIDPPREQVGAADQIIAALDAYGFCWDGPILFQSRSHAEHLDALEALTDKRLTYRCGCSRKDLATAPIGPLGIIYPGTCRAGCSADEYAIRVRVGDETIEFDDRLQGRQLQSMATESGDFIIRRKDRLIAYHLAVVVDDHLHGVTDIVRGIDLIDSTPRQIFLQHHLDYIVPSYAHIPVAIHPDGDKLSKLTGARAIDVREPSGQLAAALSALQLDVPPDIAAAPVDSIWDWALAHWEMSRLVGQKTIRIEGQKVK